MYIQTLFQLASVMQGVPPIRIRFTGEEVLFAFAYAFVAIVMVILTHARIRSLFLKDDGRPDWYTGLATWCLIIIFGSITYLFAQLWWFSFDGSGIRDDVLRWLTSQGWKVK